MFTFHGAQKILGVLTPSQPPMWSQLWFGGLIELICGLAVMPAFQARAAAFLCSGTMAVAYIQFQRKEEIFSDQNNDLRAIWTLQLICKASFNDFLKKH